MKQQQQGLISPVPFLPQKVSRKLHFPTFSHGGSDAKKGRRGKRRRRRRRRRREGAEPTKLALFKKERGGEMIKSDALLFLTTKTT